MGVQMVSVFVYNENAMQFRKSTSSTQKRFFPTVFSFPALPNEENLIGVSKPLPKQLWEAKKVRIQFISKFSC